MIPARLVELDPILTKLASAAATPSGHCGYCEEKIDDLEPSHEYDPETGDPTIHLHDGVCHNRFVKMLEMCPHPIPTATVEGVGAGENFRRAIKASSWKLAEGLASSNDYQLMGNAGGLGQLGGGTDETGVNIKDMDTSDTHYQNTSDDDGGPCALGKITETATGIGKDNFASMENNKALTGNPLGMNPDKDATTSLRQLP
jgi:hypothetical protein